MYDKTNMVAWNPALEIGQQLKSRNSTKIPEQCASINNKCTMVHEKCGTTLIPKYANHQGGG